MEHTQAHAEPDWLTIREAAYLLSVHPETLRRWERTGRIAPAARTPVGHRRYRRADLEALITRPERERAAS